MNKDHLCLNCRKLCGITKYHDDYWDSNEIIGQYSHIDIWSDNLAGYTSLCCRDTAVKVTASQKKLLLKAGKMRA